MENSNKQRHIDEKKYILPNIIFLDNVPNKKYGGLIQTLYNLFDGYPPENLYALVHEYQVPEESSLNCIQIKLDDTPLNIFKWRLLARFSPFVNKLNAVLREILGVKIDKSKLPPEGLILVCTSNINKLHAAKIIHKKYNYPLLTYFMDDWIADSTLEWWGGNANELAKYALDNSSGRLMISEVLNESLIERYSLQSKPTYIVHNPVNVKNNFQKPWSVADLKTIKIIYAGSIWDMHLDALILVANAVDRLNNEPGKRYELHIYSHPSFWNNNKSKLDKNGVVFGGFVPYDDLDDKLSKGTLLLVVSSFLKQFEAFSRSSVQTKLTDYMKIGVPILSVGPVYGACNAFVKKWQCGYVWENENINGLMDYLRSVENDDDRYQFFAKNAYLQASQHFSKPVVQQKLYEFITSIYHHK